MGSMSSDRTFRYRAHIRLVRWLVPVPLVLLSIAFVFSPAGPIGLVLTAEGLLIFAIFSYLASTRVQLTDDALIRTVGKKRTVIPLDAIERLSFPSVTYLGGWLKVRSATETIRLTVALEDLSLLVDTLVQRLDAMGKQSAYDDAKLASFMRTATLSDHSFSRMGENLSKLVLLSLAPTAATVIYCASVGSGIGWGLVLAPLSFAAAMAVLLIAELRLLADFRKRASQPGAPRRPPRNRPLEQRTYRWMLGLGLSLPLLAPLGHAVFADPPHPKTKACTPVTHEESGAASAPVRTGPAR